MEELQGIDIPSILTGAAALVTAIFAGLKWILPLWKKLITDRHNSITLAGFLKYQNLYQALKAICDIGGDRIIIFSGHNCGGVPEPGKPFFISAIHWHFNSVTVDLKDHLIPDRFQNLPVDVHYVNMLSRLVNEKVIKFDVETAEDCQLKQIYKSEGIVDSIIFFLHIADSNIYYISVSNYSRKFTAVESTEIELQVNLIKNLLCD